MNQKQLDQLLNGPVAPNSEEYLEAVGFVKQEKARLDRILSGLRANMAANAKFRPGDRVDLIVSASEIWPSGIYVINEVWVDSNGQTRYNFRKPKGRKLSEKVYFIHYVNMKKC